MATEVMSAQAKPRGSVENTCLNMETGSALKYLNTENHTRKCPTQHKRVKQIRCPKSYVGFDKSYVEFTSSVFRSMA